jgi:hypothetical protein
MLTGSRKEGIIHRFFAFLPESFDLNCLAGLLTYPGFKKPSHPLFHGQWQVFPKTMITQFGDRASQQRVLSRIPTAFPFHYNEERSL